MVGGDPLRVAACYCLACQKRTGAPFGVAVFFREERVTVSGPSCAYVRPGDSGGSVEFHFCGVCGTTLYWRPSFRPGLIAVAYGGFPDGAIGGPSRVVYEQHRPPWVSITQEDGRAAP